MCLFQRLKRTDRKEDWRTSRDKDQEEYRKAFGGIKDKYLLNYEGDKFIVYIDGDNDIEWIENTDFSSFSEEEKKQFYDSISKLDRAQAYPCMLLKEDYVISFKRILGTGYVAAFHKSFDTIDETIEESKTYVRQRNLEKARQIFLLWAGIISVLAVAFLICLHFWPEMAFLQKEIISCVVFGVLGAYFSIWMRYKDLLMTGFSTKALLAFEAVSRLFIGAISAYVVYLAYQCQLVFSLLSSIDGLYVCSFLGFLGGFCERFVPSLIEYFASKGLSENK